MFLSDFSIKRPVITVVVIIMLMCLGLLALKNLRVNQIPDVEQPVIVVRIPYPGASPETVEREIVNRVEKALQSIPQVYQIRSTAAESNATTRQVEVLVDFTGDKQPRLAGLYAEGHVEISSAETLTLPATALVREGDKSLAWRVKDGKIRKVTLALGDRDPRTGDFALKDGLAPGDQVIRHPNALLKDGQPVQAAAAPAPTKAAAKDAPSPARN